MVILRRVSPREVRGRMFNLVSVRDFCPNGTDFGRQMQRIRQAPFQ
jgi:hypothetical protein